MWVPVSGKVARAFWVLQACEYCQEQQIRIAVPKQPCLEFCVGGPRYSSSSDQILSWTQQSLSAEYTYSCCLGTAVLQTVLEENILHLGDRGVVLGMLYLGVSLSLLEIAEENQVRTVHRQGGPDVYCHLAVIDSSLSLFPCWALLGVTQPFIFEGRRSSGLLGCLSPQAGPAASTQPLTSGRLPPYSLDCQHLSVSARPSPSTPEHALFPS